MTNGREILLEIDKPLKKLNKCIAVSFDLFLERVFLCYNCSILKKNWSFCLSSIFNFFIFFRHFVRLAALKVIAFCQKLKYFQYVYKYGTIPRHLGPWHVSKGTIALFCIPLWKYFLPLICLVLVCLSFVSSVSIRKVFAKRDTTIRDIITMIGFIPWK